MAVSPRPARDALLAYAVSAAILGAAAAVGLAVPIVARNLAVFAAGSFLLIPYWYSGRRGEDLADYGFTVEPVGLGLKTAALTILIAFPLFLAGYLLFYETVCDPHVAAPLDLLAPPGDCRRYHGLAGARVPGFSLWSDAEFILGQVVVAALPEELFFRGMLLKLLEQAFPARRSVLGVRFGLAVVVSSLLFGLIHVIPTLDPLRFAPFFPSLVFAWLYLRTRSILAGTIFHAACNIYIELLKRIFL